MRDVMRTSASRIAYLGGPLLLAHWLVPVCAHLPWVTGTSSMAVQDKIRDGHAIGFPMAFVLGALSILYLALFPRREAIARGVSQQLAE